jgi:dUTP pyrophosphatase
MNTLLIYTPNNELKMQYVNSIKKHNEQISCNEYNSGFDLFVPKQINTQDKIVKLDCEIIAAMFDKDNNPMPFDLRPRSSIYKSNLLMSNSAGVIDNGYRGNIMALFYNMAIDISIEKYSRLVQICNPDLRFFKVELVNKIEDLGITKRGSGGFGSTGV